MSQYSLINMSDIYTITGLNTSTLDALIPYAEAQAEAMIGFLHKNESATQSFYIWDKTDTLKLDQYPINSVSSISYQISASEDAEDYDTDEYRIIENEGLIIFDDNISEGYKVTVTYSVGWDRSTVTSLVKLLLVVLTINQYYSLHPDEVQHSQVLVSERIGDYTKKFANLTNKEFMSLDEWSTYLANIIRKGGTEPGAHSV